MRGPSQPTVQHTPVKQRDVRAHLSLPATPPDGPTQLEEAAGSLRGRGEQVEDIASLQREAALIRDKDHARRQAAEAALAALSHQAEQAPAAAPGPAAPRLNPEQLAATLADPSRPLLLVAGAGTGKTTALLERARQLVVRHRVPPGQVALITYTSKAAREARDRLRRSGLPGTGGIVASTIHAFCFRLICWHHGLLGFAGAPSVFTSNTQRKSLFRECIQ